MRLGQFSHARMFWSDGSVRFEYLDDGIPMVQIYDVKENKIIWLDMENKLYVKKEMSPEQQIDSMIKENKTSSNPCEIFTEAECTRLKDVVMNGRDTVKWLITTNVQGLDQHIFQWLDKEYRVVVRQENPDGSVVEININDNQEMNGRKVRKLDIVARSNGRVSHGTQWYDSELNIVVRQEYENGSMDELRNIKIEEVGKELFTVPDDYKLFDATALAIKPGINGPSGPVKN